MTNFGSAADYATAAYGGIGDQQVGENGTIAQNVPASINGTFVLTGGSKRKSRSSKRKGGSKRKGRRSSRNSKRRRQSGGN